MFSCGFYNSLNGDRKYSAIQFGEMFDGLIKDGVYATIGEAFMSTPGTGLQVVVGTGRAWFNKTWSVNDARLPLDLEMADLLLPRIDVIVLEVNTTTVIRDNCIKVITGEPAITPEKPALINSDGVYQYPLAYISVKANQETVAKTDIENMVGRTPCPFVTGILESISIDDAWIQWEGQFEEWFAGVQSQLSGDVAANLLKQIQDLDDKKLNVSAKATTAQAQAGTNDTTYMTPAKVKNYVDGKLSSGGYDSSRVGKIIKDQYDGPISKYLLCDGSLISRSTYPAYLKRVGYKNGNPFVDATVDAGHNFGTERKLPTRPYYTEDLVTGTRYLIMPSTRSTEYSQYLYSYSSWTATPTVLVNGSKIDSTSEFNYTETPYLTILFVANGYIYWCSRTGIYAKPINKLYNTSVSNTVRLYSFGSGQSNFENVDTMLEYVYEAPYVYFVFSRHTSSVNSSLRISIFRVNVNDRSIVEYIVRSDVAAASSWVYVKSLGVFVEENALSEYTAWNKDGTQSSTATSKIDQDTKTYLHAVRSAGVSNAIRTSTPDGSWHAFYSVKDYTVLYRLSGSQVLTTIKVYHDSIPLYPTHSMVNPYNINHNVVLSNNATMQCYLDITRSGDIGVCIMAYVYNTIHSTGSGTPSIRFGGAVNSWYGGIYSSMDNYNKQTHLTLENVSHSEFIYNVYSSSEEQNLVMPKMYLQSNPVYTGCNGLTFIFENSFKPSNYSEVTSEGLESMGVTYSATQIKLPNLNDPLERFYYFVKVSN